MKGTILLFMSLLCLCAKGAEPSMALSGTIQISSTVNVCQNSPGPVITFSGSGGSAPYTFTYTVNGTSQTITSAANSNTVTLTASTATFGTQTYTLTGVSDSSTSASISGQTVGFLVLQQPDATITSTAELDVFNGFPTFKVCTNQTSVIDFFNMTATPSLNVNYTINWGDGTPSFSANSWSTISHSYDVGLWTLTYTISSSNNCPITKTYKVFVGNNPAVGLENPGNTDICIDASLTFPITGTENNPPGTTYIVSFNDGSASLTFNHPPPPSVTHTFLTGSCGTTSSNGSTSYQNSFYANIRAINPCDESSATVVPIRISTIPDADFSIPQGNHCINTSLCFTNTSTGGDTAASGGCTDPKIVWTVSPNTGFSVASGTLGNDASGNPNPNVWQTGSSTICLNFNVGGTYSITMKIGSRCGIDTITKTICVDAPLSPQFNLNTNAGCAPLAISAINTTNIASVCSTPTSTWTVSHAAGFCGSPINVIPEQTGPNASFTFTEPGTYTITLTMSNTCGSTQLSQTVTVAKPPEASINPISNICGAGSINPLASVNACSPTGGLTYNWSFPGGNPTSSTMANPGPVNYNTPGSHTISLTVTNECGVSSVATQTFQVNEAPSITNSNLSQSICSGTSTSEIVFSSTLPNTTYTWTATASAGVSGFIPNGSSSSIPPQILNYSGADVGTVTYTVVPSIDGCSGPPVAFQILVSPAPLITSQPLSAIYCQNASATPLTIAIDSPAGTPTYQWFQNSSNTTAGGSIIAGATSNTYIPSTSSVGTSYYYVVVSLESGGCEALNSQIAEIKIESLPQITLQPEAQQQVCVGGSIQSPLEVTAVGGTGSTTYQWYINNSASTIGGTLISGATSPTYTPPPHTEPGIYYYYVTASYSGAGCGDVTSSVAAIEVFSDPSISLQPIPEQTVCQGAATQTLTIDASGGTGTFFYQWYANTLNSTSGGTLIPGAVANEFTPPSSAVGTTYYYCVVTQNTPGCGVVSNTSKVIVNISPSVSSQPVSSQVCLGGIPQTLQFEITNGVGTASYQWFSNTENSSVGGAPIVGATSDTFTPPTDTESITWYYAEISFSGIAGECSVITTNPAMIEVTAGAEISQQPLKSQAVCVGGSVNQPLSVAYTGGSGVATYQWYSNTTSSTVGGIPVGNTPTYTPPMYTSEGIYYYYATIQLSGSGCAPIVSDIATVTVIADPVVSEQPLSSQSLCPGEIAQSLSTVVVGGIGSDYVYQWYQSSSNIPGTGVPIDGATNSVFVPDTSNTGTQYYYCVISQSASGCETQTDFSEIVVSPAPTVENQPQSQSICVGDALSPLTFSTINAVGSPVIQWFSNDSLSNTGGSAIAGATSTEFTPDNSTVGTFFYYAEITYPELAGACSTVATDAVQITINQNPVISAKTEVICSGTTFSVTPESSGIDIVPSATVYTWADPIVTPAGSITGAAAESSPQMSISQQLINLTTEVSTVVYNVTPIAGDCPGIPFTITVTVNPAINPNIIVNDNLCYGANNATITTNVTGGIPFPGPEPYQYSWNGPNGFNSTEPHLENLVPGDYSVTISDAGGCPFTQTYTISEPEELIFVSATSTNITCNGSADATINISVGGGTPDYFYEWTKDTIPFSTSQNLTNLSPGVYQVSVTDANGCGPISMSFTVTEPDPLVATIVSQINVECFGDATGEVHIDVSGGTPDETTHDYSYLWTGPDSFTSSTQNLAGVPAGEYNLIVSDQNGCTFWLSTIITQSPEIVISYTTTEITCYGANDASMFVEISGGVAPYSFSWSNLSTSLEQTNLSAGDYTITVVDALGCQKSLTINIPEAPIFMVDPVVSQISCHNANDGSIALNLVGGIAPVTLIWSDGSTAGLTRNGLGPGVYTATITDSKPCQIVRTFVIVNPDPLSLESNIEHALECEVSNSGSIDLLVSGGTPPYSYQWSTGETTEDLTQLTNGTYAVTVTDSHGCIANAQYSVFRPGPLAITYTSYMNVDCDSHDASQTFTASVSGGVPPYQLEWSSGMISGSNNETMTTNIDGLVTVSATDSRGCSVEYGINVDIPEIGNASFVPESYGHTYYGIFSISDPITFQSSITGDFQNVIWDFGDGTYSNEVSPVHTYVNPGSYVVTQTVVFPYGCEYTYTITLIVEEGYFLVVPTAFTPNNDNLNDNYRPVSKRLESLRMEIYDSWGSMVYSESGDVLVGWDGTINGVPAENGNYYCTVTANTFYGRTIIQRETFVLIK